MASSSRRGAVEESRRSLRSHTAPANTDNTGKGHALSNKRYAQDNTNTNNKRKKGSSTSLPPLSTQPHRTSIPPKTREQPPRQVHKTQKTYGRKRAAVILSSSDEDEQDQGQGAMDDHADLQNLDPEEITQTILDEQGQWGLDDNLPAPEDLLDEDAQRQPRNSSASPVQNETPRANASRDEHDNAHSKSPLPPRPPKIKRSKRVDARNQELPTFIDDEDQTPSPSNGGASDEEDILDDEEEENEDHSHLLALPVNKNYGEDAVYQPPGRGTRAMPLRKQPYWLRRIITLTYQRAVGDAMFKNAYIDKANGVDYVSRVFCEVAQEIEQGGYQDRMERDGVFRRRVSEVVIQRLSQYRSLVKKAVFPRIQPCYHLKPGSEAQQSVKSLLEYTRYICPGAEMESIDNKKPYHHEAIVSTLREHYFTGTRKSLAEQHGLRFSSSIDKGAASEELELPIPMVALVATAVHASLDEWSPGNISTRRAEFHVDAYEDVYRGHVMFLTSIAEESPAVYHRLMADLYDVSSNSISASSEKIVSNLRGLCDIAGMAT